MCSDTRTYRNGYKIEGNLFYTSDEEYDIAHGIFPEDWVKSCKQDGFALFPDILADVQKKLYEVVSGKLLEDVIRSESEQKYLNGLLDHENKTLKGLYEPYFSADIEADVFLLKDKSKNWFNGFIAKTKACADGAPEITKFVISKASRHSANISSFRV